MFVPTHTPPAVNKRSGGSHLFISYYENFTFCKSGESVTASHCVLICIFPIIMKLSTISYGYWLDFLFWKVLCRVIFLLGYLSLIWKDIFIYSDSHMRLKVILLPCGSFFHSLYGSTDNGFNFNVVSFINLFFYNWYLLHLVWKISPLS